MITVTETGINYILAKGFLVAALYSDEEEAVHKCEPEPLSVNAVVKKLVDVPSLTVPVANLVRIEVAKNTLNKVKMEKPYVQLAKAFEQKQIEIAEGILAKEFDSVRSPEP